MALKASKEKDTNIYELEITVDKETFTNAITKAYKKEVGKINIPGFRKGKAPRNIIESMYGQDFFYEDAIQDTYPAAIEDAAKEAKIKIVSVDSLNVEKVDKDGYTFKTDVTVEPELKIKDYKEIEVTGKSTEVTDELIDEEIEKVREQVARMVSVTDRAAKKGDTVVIDFEGFLEDEPFEGGKDTNFNLELGSGQFIPGFEEKIEGHKPGEEFDIDITFPEEYQAEDLAGKDTVFKVKLHEIKEKELPKVDDEFVKDISEKDTLDEYKEELKEKISERLEKEYKADVEKQIVEHLIEVVEGDVPEAMYDNQVSDMIREFDMQIRSQGADINTYLQYMGTDMEGLREMYKPEAEKRVKLRLTLEAVAKEEKIEADEKSLDEHYNRMADTYQMDVEKIKEIVPLENLKEDVKVEKAMEFVKESAKIK